MNTETGDKKPVEIENINTCKACKERKFLMASGVVAWIYIIAKLIYIVIELVTGHITIH